MWGREDGAVGRLAFGVFLTGRGKNAQVAKVASFSIRCSWRTGLGNHRDMALGVERIKRDFTRHKKKAWVLGALVVIMFVFIWRAVVELSPAAVMAGDMGTPAVMPDHNDAVSAAEPPESPRQSRELWNTLKETGGLDATVAFTFDPSYYTNNRPASVLPSPRQQAIEPAAPANSAEADRRSRQLQIAAQAQALIIRSTVVGAPGTRPVAVINGSVLSVGDQIQGFEITGIRGREVEFKKDGLPFIIRMKDADSVGSEH